MKNEIKLKITNLIEINLTLKSGFWLSRVHTLDVPFIYLVVVLCKSHPPSLPCPHSPKFPSPLSQQHFH